MSARCHQADLTTHELFVIALYRASADRERLKIDGLLYGCCLSQAGTARIEFSPLLDHTSCSHLLKFQAAAKAIGLRAQR